jgi:D-alanyl-D-alanine dipeptidase
MQASRKHKIKNKIEKKERRRDRDTIINRINIRLRYASLPSLHGRLVWDYTDRYTHRDAVKVTDMRNSARVLDKIGLRHQEGQRLRTARKERGLAIVLVPE